MFIVQPLYPYSHNNARYSINTSYYLLLQPFIVLLQPSYCQFVKTVIQATHHTVVTQAIHHTTCYPPVCLICYSSHSSYYSLFTQAIHAIHRTASLSIQVIQAIHHATVPVIAATLTFIIPLLWLNLFFN